MAAKKKPEFAISSELRTALLELDFKVFQRGLDTITGCCNGPRDDGRLLGWEEFLVQEFLRIVEIHAPWFRIGVSPSQAERLKQKGVEPERAEVYLSQPNRNIEHVIEDPNILVITEATDT